MEKNIAKPLSVIEALSAGFELVLRRPWVVILPVALDLFLWLGPQVTAEPVFQRIINQMTAASAMTASPDVMQNIEAMKSAWLSASQKFNVITFAALLAVGMPTLMSFDTPPAGLYIPHPAVISIASFATLLGSILLLMVVGVFIGTLYLELIARGVRRVPGELTSPAPDPGILKSFLNTAALIVFASVGGMLLLIPFMVAAAVVGFVSQGLGSFLVILGLLLILWGALYLAFAVPAIFVSGANLRQAVANSVAIFRYNFWSALGLIFLIYLIEMGFSIVWQQLFGNALGVFVDVIANAFLGSGLVAAGMLFYQDRITLLVQVRERIRQNQSQVKR